MLCFSVNNTRQVFIYKSIEDKPRRLKVIHFDESLIKLQIGPNRFLHLKANESKPLWGGIVSYAGNKQWKGKPSPVLNFEYPADINIDREPVYHSKFMSARKAKEGKVKYRSSRKYAKPEV